MLLEIHFYILKSKYKVSSNKRPIKTPQDQVMKYPNTEKRTKGDVYLFYCLLQ